MTKPLPERFDWIQIDGDILVYGICSACEYCARFDDDLDVVFCNIKEVLHMVESAMTRYQNMAKGDLTVYFTGSGNFRKNLCSDYKAHRKKVRKPAGYKAVKELLADKYHCMTEDGLEADDLISLYQTAMVAEGGDSLIISIDKDFKTIPGWMFNPDTEQFTYTTPEEAEVNWLTQVLTGDKADGYPGLAGVGPVTAKKILKKGEWAEVEQAYIDNGYTREFAILQAQMARLLRFGEYNFMTKEVKLWQPATS